MSASRCLHGIPPPTNDNERGIIQALTVSLADAAMRLSGSYDGRKVGLQLFVQKLVDVARRWPAFAKYNGPALIQGLNRLPANDAPDFSELMCLFRTQA